MQCGVNGHIKLSLNRLGWLKQNSIFKRKELMDPINCSIAQGNLKFRFVAVIGDNLKVPLEELKLINSSSTS